ncbi:MAG: RluA family pseudouridine synthase [Verrucomicrobiota bacterium]|nr:RluA family pseudouridine synthase [Verrucomicrobiota bacterium]
MRWLVPEGQKLVQFLQTQIDPPPSGKILRKVLEANLCRVNGKVERFGSAEVAKGDVVELAPSWTSVATERLNGFDRLYEDEYLLIADKPAGWVCTDEECTRAFGGNRYLIHRLDKETTGILLIAKSVKAREAMISLFMEHKVSKLYYAVVDGVPEEERGSRKSFFAKVGHFQGQTRWGSRPKGLYAETHWKVLAAGRQTALVACQPITGRTHQIRVHLAEMGHPILVDRQYAERFRCSFFAKRPLLHAFRIRFVHPFTGQEVDITSEPADDFLEALQQLDLVLPIEPQPVSPVSHGCSV